jgi:lysine 2,3-aminomutase
VAALLVGVTPGADVAGNRMCDMATTETKRLRTLRTPADLLQAGMISPADLEHVTRIQEGLAIAISPEMVGRMTPDRADDPISRQFVPDVRELTILPEERPDPIGDVPYMPLKGITHRYPDRLLLTPTLTCAVYCRFCFRREKVGPNQEYLSPQELAAALDYIRSQPEVREVILTGGDPLVLSPRRIGEIVRELAAIRNLDVIRFHTRMPIVAPERITAELLEVLDVEKIICMVIHANHAAEFGDAAKASIKRLRKAGFMLVSHSVLLKGVNDTPEAMTELLRELVRNGVKPYYLHHCDLAEGISHFRTTFEEGQELMRAIRGHVSGLAQPSYVLHIPGGHGKVPIGPSYLERDGDGWIVTDYKGIRHRYPHDCETRAAMGV